MILERALDVAPASLLILGAIRCRSVLRHFVPIFVAVALNEAVSQVIRGENKGRKLRHIAVVKSLAQIGKVTGTTFSKEIDVPKDMPDGAYRVIAFVQEHGQGRVLGSAIYKPIL